ncbi:MAG: hypothetical protein K1060chlam1_00615 [Candidatus Anoxychlamydiales bacterium]|nr:hypothetical protein [Candidatus Anoxychlamydiales bacterium]
MAISALEGHWIGNSANLYKQTEDSARVGVNRFLTASAQIASISNAIFISTKALDALKFSFSTTSSFLTKTFLYLTPIITNAFCYKFNLQKNPYLKRSVILINNHIGSICNLAIAIASIALISLGLPFLGYISLTWIIIGFIQRRRWLPLKVSTGINFIGFVGTNVARLALGNYHHKFVALLEIGNLVYLQVAAYKKRHLTIKTSPPNILITNSFNADSLQVDPKHLTEEFPIPKPPEVDLKKLKTIFQKFNLSNPNYLKILKKAIFEDEYWNEFHSDKNSDAELINYIKTGLNNFINNVSNRTIKSGEISDYRFLQARAKHIAYKLSSSSNEDQFINIIHLALASYYCPAGYLEKVRSIYYTVCSAFELDSIKSRVSQVLDNGRRHLFQSFLHSFLSRNSYLVKVLLDPQDNHVYNEFVNFLGESFNLSECQDAEQDALSYLGILDKKFMQLLYRPIVRPFINKYNKDFIIETLYEALTNNQIPYELINRWFIDEYLLVLRPKTPIHRNETDRNYNERLIQEARRWARENVYNIMTGKIEEKYLSFFLIKMGILK